MQRCFIVMAVTVLVNSTGLFANIGVGSFETDRGRPTQSLDTQWGPDIFGYLAKGSNEPDGPSYDWIDISGIGTLVTGLGDDNVVGPFSIGWNFRYYWYDVSSFSIGSNGWIKFSGAGQLAQPFPAIPTTGAPNDVIAPYAADWIFGPSEPGECYMWSNNVDTLIVSWVNVRAWLLSGNLGDHTFQLILSGADSSITFQYGTSTTGDVSNNSITVGIENLNGEIGLHITDYFNAYPENNSAIKIYYPETVTYEVHDMKVEEVQNLLSRGMFIVTGDTLDGWMRAKNAGNQSETGYYAAYTVRLPDNTAVATDTINAGAIAAGGTDDIAFTGLWSPASDGVYRLEGAALLNGDMFAGNDTRRAELHAVTYPCELAYDDGIMDRYWHWSTGNAGLGMSFAPPVYPCEVTSARVYVGTTGGDLQLQVLDDDGPNGLPGTVLWSQDVYGAAADTWASVSIPVEAVVILDGEFYVSAIQIGASQVGFGLDTTSSQGISRRTLEFVGDWADFRFIDSHDLMVRASVRDIAGEVSPLTVTCEEAGNTPANGRIDDLGDVLHITANLALPSPFSDSVLVGLDVVPDLGVLIPEAYPTIVLDCPSGLTATLYQMDVVVTEGRGMAGWTPDSCLVTAQLTFHPAFVNVPAGALLDFNITWFAFANTPPPGYQPTYCLEANYTIAAPCQIQTIPFYSIVSGPAAEAVCIEDPLSPNNGVIDLPEDSIQITTRAEYRYNYGDSTDVGLDPLPDLGEVQPGQYPTIIINCPSGLTGELYEMNVVVTPHMGLNGPVPQQFWDTFLDQNVVTATLTFHPQGVVIPSGTPVEFGIVWFGFTNTPPPGGQQTLCLDAGYSAILECEIDPPSVGTLYEAGTTFYELQHNHTAGRMIAGQLNGRMHVVWTHADVSLANRHIYYNWFNPVAGAFAIPGGVQIDSSLRSGFPTVGVNPWQGWVYPSYHEIQPSDPNPHATAAINGAVGGSWFLSTQPEYLYYDSLTSVSSIWPKIAHGASNMVHMVSTSESSTDGSNVCYYSRGIGQFSGGFGTGIDWQSVDVVNGQPVEYMFVDTTAGVSANIAASPWSNRVVIVWNRPLYDPLSGQSIPEVSDVYMLVSEDNGLNWGAPFNITGFCGPDANCPSQDWQTCNIDTLRGWLDNSVMFDVFDNIHVAFTVVPYQYRNANGEVVHDTDHPRSAIWHWDEATDGVRPVATAFGEPSIFGGWAVAGSNHRAVCKPSLAADSAFGGVYCSYWRGMPDQWSGNMYPMGDIYLSRSTDGGQTWSVGRNVTETDGGQYAPTGSSLSERDATLAEIAEQNGNDLTLHLFYELDYDAGTAQQGEGSITENELYYQRVPVDSIPATPTVPWQPLHVAPVTGACCYTNELNEIVCEQQTVCACDALGGEFIGIGTSDCEPEYDHCPGLTVDCLPFTYSGNNCCATPDWEDCGISTKEIFFNYTPTATTTARLSLCDSPESWNSYIAIYAAGANGSCTDSFRVGCLDDGCGDPLHVNQLFTFEGGQTYYILVCGYFLEDCGPFVFNMTDETDYSRADTLVFDSDTTQSVHIDSIWASVRFTAPGPFSLQTAYVKTLFGDSSLAPCNVFVYYAPPAPGGEIASAYACVPYSSGWSDPQWVNTSFDNAVSIPAGTDIWVVAGPIPQGLPFTGAWKITNTTSNSGRSEVSRDGLYGTYTSNNSDLALRVGGVLGLGSPDSLVIRPADNGADVELRWSPSYGATEYDVYRSESEDIQPLPENFLGTTLATSFVDFGVLTNPAAQYYYIVTATGSESWLRSDDITPAQSSAVKVSAPMQVKQR